MFTKRIEMSSVPFLRQFVSERLTAAAEEIFRVFEKNIVEYEEEIDRQRRLLDVVWKPEVRLQKIELLQKYVFKEDWIFTDQGRSASLDQEDPEPPHVKEEQEELYTSQEGEKLELKQESQTFMLIPAYGDSEPEPNSDQQLLPHSSPVAENQDQEGINHGDSASPRKAERKPKQRRHKHTNHSNHVDTSSVTTHTVLPQQHVCKEVPLTDQQLPNQDRNSSLDQDHPPQVKEEQDELRNSQELVLKQKTDTFMLIPAYEESENSEPEPKSDQQLLSQSSLMSEVHCDSHSSQKSIKCDTCEKPFKYKSQLKIHLRCHTGEKPYTCSTCEKRFSQVSALYAHFRIHTGEKPYVCEICGKRCREKSKLKKHMRTHTGERPYPCVFCGKRFSDTPILKTHMKLHTGEKPFSCNTCGKRFSIKQNLQRHIRTHTRQTL